MKRPLFTLGSTLLFSVAVSFLCTIKQGLLLSGALVLTAILFVLLKNKALNNLTIIVLSVSLGLAVGAGYKYIKIEPFEAYVGEDVILEGLVEDVRYSSAHSVRYTVSASFPNNNLPNSRIIVRDYISSELKAGDKVIGSVRMQHSKFESVQSSYIKKGIPLEGILLEEPEYTSLTRSESIWQRIIMLRQKIKFKNLNIYSEDSAAVVNAMVFGMTEDLSADLYSDLNRSGTSHLLSVSGLHLSVFTAFVMLLLGKSKLPKRLQWLIAMIANIGFTMLVGFSPPMIRSCIMSLMFLTGNMIGRKSDSVNSLGFSAVIISIVWPYWTLSTGMWLSYFATAGILFLGTGFSDELYQRYKGKNQHYNRLIRLVAASLGITAGAYIFTLPILIVKNGWVSIISPLANLLVSPFSSVVVVGGILAAVLPTSIILYPLLVWVVEWSTKLITTISKLLASLPFAAFSLDHIALFVAVVIAFVLLITAWIFRKKAGAIALALVVCVAAVSIGEIVAVMSQSNKIQLVSLGEDQSQVLIRGKSAVVVGLPDKYNIEGLIKYLEYRSVSSIDCLIANNVGSPVGTTITRLAQAYDIKCVIGTDDAFILEEISELLPGIPVYASGYSKVNFLGGGAGVFSDNGSDIALLIGSQKVIIQNKKYDIMDNISSTDIYIFADGVIILPKKVKLSKDPLGSFIYNEKRISIPI